MLQLTEKLDHCHQAPLDELHLPFELRKRGRLRATTLSGREVGLFLNRGQVLITGDMLKATTGELIRVVSAPETVVTVPCSNDLVFARVCYHLGNRHVPLQIGAGWLRLQPDHVLEAMIQRFGLHPIREEAPFEPENGAYSEHASTGHAHSRMPPHTHSFEHGRPEAHAQTDSQSE